MQDALALIEQEAKAMVGMLRIYATSTKAAEELTTDDMRDLEADIAQMVLRERFGVSMSITTLNKIWSRAAEGLNHLKDTTVLVAIPGLGKTSFTRDHPDAADIDYGNWRRRWAASRKDLSAEQYVRILGIFVLRTLAVGDAWDRRVVFVNELDLIPFYVALGLRVSVFIPADEFVPQWLAGIVTRTATQAADNLDVGMEVLQRFEFCIRAVAQHRVWLQDWQDAANAKGIPVHRIDTWLSKLSWDKLLTP